MVSNGDRERENGTGDAPFAPFGPGPAGGAPYGMGGAPMGGAPNGGAPMGGGSAGGGPLNGGPASSGPAGGAFMNGAAGGPAGGNGSAGGPQGGSPAGGFFGGGPSSGPPGGPSGGPSGGPPGGAPGGPSGGRSGGRPGGNGRGGDPFGSNPFEGDPFRGDPFGGEPFGGGNGAFGGNPAPNAPSPDNSTQIVPTPNFPGAGGPAPAAPEDDASSAGKSRRSRRSKGDKNDKNEKVKSEKNKDAKGGENVPGTPQSRVGWSPYDEGHRSRAPLWFAIGGVLVLGLFGGGLALMFNADSPVTAEAGVTRQTSAPLPTVPGGKYGFAADRKTDPDSISVKEIFGSKKKFTVSGRGYEMTITSKDKKCPDGVLGDKIEKALKSAKCTQFVRASFRDKAGEVIGTVGVANLSTSSQSAKVAKAGSNENYVKPLEGKDSVTKFLGSGSGGAKIATYGHYAILYWFQNKDGTKPDSKGTKRISEAINDITKATVFPALDNRALTGSGGS